MKNNHREQGGFIKTVILIVIILIALGYFGFNIKSIIQSPTVSGNLQYAWELVVQGWNMAVNAWDKFVVGPIIFVWDKLESFFNRT